MRPGCVPCTQPCTCLGGFVWGLDTVAEVWSLFLPRVTRVTGRASSHEAGFPFCFYFYSGKPFLRCQAYPVAEEKCLVRQSAMFSAREGQDARLLSAWHPPQTRPAVASMRERQPPCSHALGTAGHTGRACHAPRDHLRCRAGECLVISTPLGLTRREMWSRVYVECSAEMSVLWVINKSVLGFIFSKSGGDCENVKRAFIGLV